MTLSHLALSRSVVVSPSLRPLLSLIRFLSFFFFNDTATTEIYTLSLHDALPISTPRCSHHMRQLPPTPGDGALAGGLDPARPRARRDPRSPRRWSAWSLKDRRKIGRAHV